MNKSRTVDDIAMAQEKETNISNYRLQVLGNKESTKHFYCLVGLTALQTQTVVGVEHKAADNGRVFSSILC